MISYEIFFQILFIIEVDHAVMRTKAYHGDGGDHV